MSVARVSRVLEYDTQRYAVRSSFVTRVVIKGMPFLSLVWVLAVGTAVRAQEQGRNKPEVADLEFEFTDFEREFFGDKYLEHWKPADWSLLQTMSSVTKVRIILFENGKVPRDAGLVGDERFALTTRDPKTLEIMGQCLFMPLRLGCQNNRPFFAGGGGYTLGKIIVWTKKDKAVKERKFMVGITTAGFVLNSKRYEVQRLFFSWGVAKVIDDLLFEKRKVHIRKDVFGYLSGEAWIASQKETYEYLQKWYSNKKKPQSQRPTRDPRRKPQARVGASTPPYAYP